MEVERMEESLISERNKLKETERNRKRTALRDSKDFNDMKKAIR